MKGKKTRAAKWLALALALAMVLGTVMSPVLVEKGNVVYAAESYDASKVYLGGDVVEYNGQTYKAKWWTQGMTPGTAGSAWELQSETNEDGTESYYEGKVFTGGQTVTYKGSIYRANWWTNSVPGSDSSWTYVGPASGEETGGETEQPGGGETGGETEQPGGGETGGETEQPGDNEDTEVEVPSDIPAYVSGTVYWGGDRVTYNGSVYEALWWTMTIPGSDSSWKQITVLPSTPGEGGTEGGSEEGSTVTPSEGTKDFKIVGYYPSWQPGKVDSIQYNNLTHIIYAFAIPDGNGGLLDLDSPETAKTIIKKGHENGVKVTLAIGGWSYNDIPLETAFISSTNTDAKIEKFAQAIVDMMNQYGFDGVDMDWEHPRTDGESGKQYEKLMLKLREKLGEDKILTSAVLGGVTADGIVQYDAAAHTDAVISVVDWFNVMAYDGGDGDRHSSYEFAVNCASYWKDTRNMPANKVVLGVPFYGRPSWATYAEILANDPTAYSKDISDFNGKQAYYNGIPTIQKKTQWACDNVGGIMIWEISQDSTNPSTSLLTAIANKARENNKFE